ncbi:MAG: hypothetical protein HN745_14945 [Deltaproteobacteria bacterium]|jgi:hypothetical protein|nr:hypothetical protein [Deltaproteobacteria bacterium]
MEAIEFKARIRDGVIRIPQKYRQKTGNTVKVILISEQGAKHSDIIDKLLEDPLKSEDFSPFLREEIYERV